MRKWRGRKGNGSETEAQVRRSGIRLRNTDVPQDPAALRRIRERAAAGESGKLAKEIGPTRKQRRQQKRAERQARKGK